MNRRVNGKAKPFMPIRTKSLYPQDIPIQSLAIIHYNFITKTLALLFIPRRKKLGTQSIPRSRKYKFLFLVQFQLGEQYQ